MGKFSIKNKLLLGEMIAIILIMLGIWQSSYFSRGNLSVPTTPTSTTTIPQSKIIRSSNLPLKEVWRWSGRIIAEHTPNLTIANNYLVLVTIENQNPPNIITFDILGNQLWKKPYSETKLPNNFDSLNTDGIRVYIGSGQFLQAFDINNGNLLWTGAEESAGIPGPLNVYLYKGTVYGYSYYDYMIYRLEAQTQ